MKSAKHKMCDFYDANEFLSQAIHIDDKIDIISKTLSDIYANCDLMKSRMYGFEKVQTSLNKSNFENAIIKLTEQKERLTEELKKLVDLKVQIIQTIENVQDGEARRFLRWIYLQGETVRSYGEIFGYSEKTASRRKLDALSKVVIPKDKITL
ncbi:MAG: hypothetical protein PUG10_06190 [Lachnospiraceae bacterium]|nr:hypothetical protein [Lachnospiraceae bacterium]